MDAWNILVVVVLALILLLILPMVAARNGTKSFTQALMAPLHRKKKRGPLGLEVEPEKKPERHVNNSMQGELTAIVSQLITFTKRQHYTLVYPGTIQEGGQLTTTLALVVTPGGVVGLNVYHGFVHDDPAKQTAEMLARHAAHMAEVMGVEHVACGFDFCEYFGPGNEGARGMEDCSQSGNFFACLSQMGVSEREMEMIARENLLRILK